MKKYLSLILAFIMTVTMLAGCDNIADLKGDPVPKENDIVSKQYVMGKTYITQSGENAQIEADIYAPAKASKVPVMFILGDGGNDYIAKELASYGIVALDVVSVGRSSEDCQKMISLLKGEIEEDKIDIDGGIASKADTERLAFVGFGEAGGQAISLATAYKDTTRGVLAVEPYLIEFIEQYPDVNFAIVLHENDRKSDGQEIFETLRQNAERTTFASYAYMYDAISSDDNKQNFIKKYAVDFMYAAFGLQANPAMLMLTDYNKNGNLYGMKVKTAFSAPEKRVLSDPNRTLHPRAAGVSVKSVSSMPELNMANGFVLPGMVMDLRLQMCNWDNKGVDIILDEADKSPRLALYSDNFGVRDLSEYKYITFYLTVNPADKDYFIADQKPEYSVRITDTKGNVQTVELNSESPAFWYSEGENDSETNLWSVPNPLGTVAVALCEFDKVDLTSVNTVNLVVEEVEIGTLMIGDISAVKAMDK